MQTFQCNDSRARTLHIRLSWLYWKVEPFAGRPSNSPEFWKRGVGYGRSSAFTCRIQAVCERLRRAARIAVLSFLDYENQNLNRSPHNDAARIEQRKQNLRLAENNDSQLRIFENVESIPRDLLPVALLVYQFASLFM
jgi:hypothetical protein